MWQYLIGKMIEKNSIRIQSENCINVRYKNGECGKCQEICPHNAIMINDKEVKVDELACDQCGMCTHICPTDTFRFEEESLLQYEQKIRDQEMVCFTCKKQGNSNTDILLPCLKLLSLELLMIAAQNNAPIQVYIDTESCLTCNISFEQSELIDLIKSWNDLTNEEYKVNIIYHKKLKKTQYKKFSRRDFFSISKNKTKQQLREFLHDPVKEITLNDKVKIGERRRYLKKTVKQEDYNNKLIKPEMAKKMNLGFIDVDQECTLCGRCAVLCPTGALQTEKQDEDQILLFDASICIDCNICTSNCKYIKKIEPDHITCGKLDDKIELKSMKFNMCLKCGGLKNIEEDLCEDCKRKDLKKRELIELWM